MNINVNDTNIGSLLDLSELDAKSKKTDEKIRSVFGKKEPLAATLKLSQEGKSAASEKTASRQAVQSSTVQQQKATGKKAPQVTRDLVRTGYAAIDNTIIDSLNGVSDEVRQYAYDIVRNDLLLEYAEDISEDERQNLISLGLSEAQYIADNYLSGNNAKAFMSAIKKVAGIAANGVCEEDGTMNYGGIYRTDITENGYTVQITDTFNMMKRYRPDMYKEYKAIQKEFKETATEDRDTYALLKRLGKVMNQFMKEMIAQQPEAFKEFERDGLRKLERASDKDVKPTFRNVDTKGTQNFIQSLMQMQKGNAFSPFPTLTNRINTIIDLLGSQTWQSGK